MISFLKSKLRLAVSFLVSLVLLSSPIIAKAAPNNFGMPPGFDWKAEKERQLKLFEKAEKRERAKHKNYESILRSSGGDDGDGEEKYFPSGIHCSDVLVTKDGSSESGSSFIGHAGLVFDSTSTVESSPWHGGVYQGKADDWMGWNSKKKKWNKSSVYILRSTKKWHEVFLPACDWAYTQIGKPYNWNYFDRWTMDSYYCSQLVWRAYLDKLDIDLCPDAWNCVSPGDILNSNELDTFYARPGE